MTDPAAGAALLVGVASLMWGLARLFEERGERDYTIGTDAKASFQIGDGLAVPLLPLLHSTGTDEVTITQQMSGDVREGDVVTSLAEAIKSGKARPSASTAGAYALPIAANSRINIRSGKIPSISSVRLAPSGCLCRLKLTGAHKPIPAPFSPRWVCCC